MPDQELNEIIALKVMGYTRYEGDAVPENCRHVAYAIPVYEGVKPQVVWVDSKGQRAACSWCGDTVPDYVNDIVAAWSVVEKLASMLVYVRLQVKPRFTPNLVTCNIIVDNDNYDTYYCEYGEATAPSRAIAYTVAAILDKGWLP